MSDGNYNRNLLPYNNYRSGLNAGHAQMKRRALEAFDTWYAEVHPDARQEQVEAARRAYRALLEK